MQRIFYRLIKNKPIFENEEHEKAWIIRVTINCSSKLLTSAWFRHTTPLKEELKFESEEKSDVYFAVLDLPIKYRTIIQMKLKVLYMEN